MKGVNEQLLRVNNFEKLDAVSKPLLNLKKLLSGRIDLWFTTSSTVPEILKKAGVNPEQIEEVYVVKTIKLYIAFNKNTPDKVIESWQKIFIEIYESGRVKKIFEKHNMMSLYPEKN